MPKSTWRPNKEQNYRPPISVVGRLSQIIIPQSTTPPLASYVQIPLLRHLPPTQLSTTKSQPLILSWSRLFKILVIVLPKDSTFMSNLEGFIPQVCQLAQEVGEGERETKLRSVGLQAISSLEQHEIVIHYYIQFLQLHLHTT
ncbi:hypothetical protein V6N12_072463 [Hibiscus sabdariffa]|uniref:Uncharacterized protein n=1 Tax=Hibiscus sabdariffa TaxID=183260 RepID=A0ABR2FMX5_9ROSI